MMRTTITTLLAGLAATMLTFTLAAPAQAANSDVYPRVRTVDASDTYVIYKQKTTTHGGLLFSRGTVKLYYVGKDLKRHALTGFNPSGLLDLAGNVVIEALDANRQSTTNLEDQRYVHWFNLKTHDQGTLALAAGDTLTGATPTGWVVRRTTGETGAADQALSHIIAYRTDGSTSDLGAPFKDGTDFYVQTGPMGLVAYSVTRGDNGSAGAIRYQAYAKAGSWRTLFNSHQNINIVCTYPSGSRVACEIEHYLGAKHDGFGSFSLTGGTTRWVDNHRSLCQTSNYYAFGNSVVAIASDGRGACTTGRLYRLGGDDKVAISKAKYNTSSNTRSGLGKIVISSKSDRSLISLTGVTAKPKTVVTAH